MSDQKADTRTPDPGPRASRTRAGDRAASLLPAAGLIAAVLLVKIVYIVWLCPYNLVEDEAHYWLWSRHLDWSYYSKGPGIAWAIWLSTRLLGHAEWAVRMPTVLAQAVGALACAGLVRDMVVDSARARGGEAGGASAARAAVFGAGAYLLAPAYQLTGILVTIDGCYLACWALACWAAWRAVVRGSRGAWLALGAAVGVGFLFKYTILLLVPGLAGFAWSRRRGAMGVSAPAAWIALGVVLAAALMSPVVWWNAREGWPTLRHLLGHLGVAGGDVPVPGAGAGGSAEARGYNPMWTLGYLAAPLGMIGPLLVLGVVAIRKVRGPGAAMVVWSAAPLLVFYLVVSFIAEPEQNWAIAAFVLVVALAGAAAAEQRGRRGPVRVLWRLGVIYGVAAAVFLHRGDLLAAGVNAAMGSGPGRGLFRAVTGREPRPVVLGRLIGTRQMAADAARVLDGLGPDAGGGGSGPLLIAEHYGRASQMAYEFWRLGRPGQRVLCTQSVMGGRKSQFDFWPDTDLRDPALKGRAALMLSNDKPWTVARWRELFESVEPLARPDQKLEGEHKKDRVAWVGRGYRGP